MKTSVKILAKVLIITYLLCITPFFHSLPSFLGLDETFITSSVYEQDFLDSKISIKDQLILMKVNENVTLSDTSVAPIKIESGQYVDNSNTPADTVVPKVSSGKKVYIYNSHQQEGYQDNKTVVDTSVELANQLQAAGVEVVYETNDFNAYLRSNGWDYNSSYKASYYYLNEAFVNYGGFDLVIDLHRDSAPRESSVVNVEGKDYAKMMFVLGSLSKNYNTVTTLSNTLTQLVSNQNASVMKQPMPIQATFNQECYENMVLIEIGSESNKYEEVKNSTTLLAKAIVQYFG